VRPFLRLCSAQPARRSLRRGPSTSLETWRRLTASGSPDFGWCFLSPGFRSSFGAATAWNPSCWTSDCGSTRDCGSNRGCCPSACPTISFPGPSSYPLFPFLAATVSFSRPSEPEVSYPEGGFPCVHTPFEPGPACSQRFSAGDLWRDGSSRGKAVRGRIDPVRGNSVLMKLVRWVVATDGGQVDRFR
jgi:hypothetical protein